MEHSLTGVILAGGGSTRFGADKASALLRGRPLLQWVADALEPVCSSLTIVHAQGQRLPETSSSLPILAVEDFALERGPLVAIIAGLRACQSPAALVTSCDAPLLQPRLCAHLAPLLDGHDAVVPKIDGRLQPLVGVYDAAMCLGHFEAALTAGSLSLQGALAGLRLATPRERDLLPFDADLRSFLNANRREDLAAIDALLGQLPG